ncbi:MAG: SAM-dependent methyltransferase [Micromonosporaceae bacterium]|nr:SAM-dependent methyltransferase [Micromonosporaceae bacterium]
MPDAAKRHDPPRFDPTVPNVARMYDYYLGGKNNFAADREAAEQALTFAPELREGAHEARKFLSRVVFFLADEGIRQFIDLGCGLPTQGNVHEVAQGRAPGSRVVYVDNDPVVVAHARALLENNPLAVAIHGDLRQVGDVLADPALRRHLDFTQPVAVLLFSVLHVIADDEVCQRIMDEARESVPDGSYFAISHFVSDLNPDAYAKVAGVYRDKVDIPAHRRTTMRSSAEVIPFFAGLEMVEPGLVYLPRWRPDAADLDRGLPEVSAVGGVGRKLSVS